MHLFVTGGAGFIGSAFVREAVWREHQVLNIDALTYAGDSRTNESVRNNRFHKFVRADICDVHAMKALVHQFRPDAIINFAAETHVDRSIDGPAVFLSTNVIGTFTLLDVAALYWSDLAPTRRENFRFVQISTDEVYGSLGAEGYFSEISRYAPNSPYAASKAAGDLLTLAWRSTYGLPTIVSNCTNNYGPFQHPEKLIPTVLRTALAQQAIPIYGNGENRRDWLYVDDHVDGVFKILDGGVPGESYVFGSGADLSNLDLTNRICAALDIVRPSPRGTYRDLITLVADRPGHDYRYAVDSTKANKVLGWSTKTRLDVGLARTIDWYLSNPDWLTRGEDLGRRGLSCVSVGNS